MNKCTNEICSHVPPDAQRREGKNEFLDSFRGSIFLKGLYKFYIDTSLTEKKSQATFL